MIEDMDVQELIDTGMAWQLEGHIGRQCMDAIQAGYAMLPPQRQRDYWGNTIPSRDDVVPGTPGSREYMEARQDDA